MTEKDLMRQIQTMLKSDADGTIRKVRAALAAVDLTAEVNREIDAILSTNLNTKGREKVASLIVYLAKNLKAPIEGISLKEAQSMDGHAYLVFGIHITKNHAKRFFDAVRPHLPAVPQDPKSPDEIPEIAVHVENINKGILQMILKEGALVGIKSPDDKAMIFKLYKKARDMMREQLQREARALRRGDWQSSNTKVIVGGTFERAVGGEIELLMNEGYRIHLFMEDPEPETWWLWDRSEMLFQEAAQAFVAGNVEDVERLFKKGELMRYEADLKRDFNEEGLKINRRIKDFPKATHIITRGLKHYQMSDVIQIPPDRRHAICALPEPVRLEDYESPLMLLHRLRYEGRLTGPDATALEERLRLQEVLISFITTSIVSAGYDMVDVSPSLNAAVSQFNTEDIRRIIRSFYFGPNPRGQDCVYEAFYRAKANFPNAFPEDLVRIIEQSIEKARGSTYVPRSTLIPATSAIPSLVQSREESNRVSAAQPARIPKEALAAI